MADATSPSVPNRSVAVVLLAAGASTRMGSPKQLLTLDGLPLILRAVRTALATRAWPVVVVLGAHRERIQPLLAREPVLIAFNPRWSEGMSSSLRVGIETVEAFSGSLDGAIVALCDQPALAPHHLDSLVDAFARSGRPLVAAQYAARRGAPVLFARSYFSRLRSLSGDAGARALLSAAGSDEVLAIDLPELAADLDTPADYGAYPRGFHGSPTDVKDATSARPPA